MLINLNMKEKDELPIMIGTNETYFYDGNIIYVKAIGEQTVEVAQLHREYHHKMASSTGEKISYLIDLNQCGKNSSEARMIWKQLSEDEHTKRVATFGLSPVSRVIASFVMGRSSLSNHQFFKTKEKAMIWLLA